MAIDKLREHEQITIPSQNREMKHNENQTS